MITKEGIRQVVEEFQYTVPRTQEALRDQHAGLDLFFLEVLEQNEDALYDLFWEDFKAWLSLSSEERWDAHTIYRDVFEGIVLVYTPRAIEFVGGLILHPDFPRRDRAAEVLGNWGKPEGFSYLVEALQDENYEVRARAAFALGQLGDVRAEPVLLALIDTEPHGDEDDLDERAIVRDNDLSGLSRLATETALGKIVQVAVQDDDTGLRCKAIRLMKYHLGQDSLPFLHRLAQDEVESVAETAQWHINDINKKARREEDEWRGQSGEGPERQAVSERLPVPQVGDPIVLDPSIP